MFDPVSDKHNTGGIKAGFSQSIVVGKRGAFLRFLYVSVWFMLPDTPGWLSYYTLTHSAT